MNILLANKYFYRKGGAESSFFITADLLRRKGHNVIFFSMQDERNDPSEYERYFVSNVDYEKPGVKNKIDAAIKLLYSYEAKNKIEQLIKREKPDIAHLNNIYHQISPSIIHGLKKFNIPVVMTLRDYKLVCASYNMLVQGKACEACKDGKYYHCFLKGCVKGSKAKSLLNTIEMYLHHKILSIYNMVDIFISPSRFLKNKVGEMGAKGKFVYLPNFVRVDEFQPQYTWNENSIVYFGRLSEEKGLLTLVKAMKDIPEISLKIIGEGPLRERLESEIRRDVIGNIRFLGYKSGEELNNEVRKSMFVVLPSEWYENNPRTIIEGFALGKPAVGSRIGGIPELVRDDETGFTFQAGDPEDLKKKILLLAKNPEKILLMGKRARSFVEQELNPEKHYEKLMEIYKQAM
jgi:glycosyltransferase involved in cell wall biosynthesis